MNIKDTCEYIETLQTDNYLSEEFTDKGLGQTTGGYIDAGIKTQKEHFLNYYRSIHEKNPDKKPTFNYLRCPELILFTAEAFGVPKKLLDNAYKIIEKYEQNEKINVPKNGNFFWGKQVFRDFKNILKISEVNKVICDKDNIEDIKKEVKEIFK